MDKDARSVVEVQTIDEPNRRLAKRNSRKARPLAVDLLKTERNKAGSAYVNDVY